MPFTVPVVLIVFNRSDFTARALDCIRRVRPQRLYVLADGARTTRPDDDRLVRETRAVVEQRVDWPCEVRRIYSDTNLGCARRVSSGLDAVFAQEEAAIILEDDCLAAPSFFPYCAELLGRYRDNEIIAQIAGCSFQDRVPAGGPSYYFSRYPHCWGWATWRRAWKYYDHSMAAWHSADREWLAAWIEHPAERRIWTDRFAATAAGEIDSWAFRWTLAVWRRRALTALPYRNLVSNVGFGDSATHTRRANPSLARQRVPLSFPLIHPTDIVRNGVADEHTSQLLFRRAPLFLRAWRRLKALFGP